MIFIKNYYIIYIESEKKITFKIYNTAPSDALLDFVLEYDLTDILISRNEYGGFQIGGTGTHNGTPIGTAVPKRSSSRKYLCPCCGMSIRATREVNIGCLDCAVKMVPAA